MWGKNETGTVVLEPDLRVVTIVSYSPGLYVMLYNYMSSILSETSVMIIPTCLPLGVQSPRYVIQAAGLYYSSLAAL